MSIPAFGTSLTSTPLYIFLQDYLAGMGDYLNTTVGSLNWCECLTDARATEAKFNIIQLLSNQLSPATASVWLDRWAVIYNTAGLTSIPAIQEYINIIQAFYGTPPTVNNVNQLLNYLLGVIYLGVQWAPELQYLATVDPYTDLIVNKLPYSQPLAYFYVYVWQPRDNQDNLLMSTIQFNSIVDTYKQLLLNWMPHYTETLTLNLINTGNHLSGSYEDGYDVVSGTAGTNTLTGVHTTFTQDFFPQPDHNTLPTSIAITPPIQIVDDSGTLQTYYVATVNSDTSITLTSNLINNITSRTYRTLGIVLDAPGYLDGGSLFSH